MTEQRVAVFIDYQNIYRGARRAFFEEANDPGFYGHINPRKLGVLLQDRVGSGSQRKLVGVRIYRGLPSSSKDAAGYAAARRQQAMWDKQGLVQSIMRPLNYRNGPPREKGIDVALAIDFVMGAQRDEYDIGILCSEDTDLLPAIEAVTELKGPEVCETFSWRSDAPDARRPNPLRLPDKKLGLIHLLTRDEFDRVKDEMDYNIKTKR